MKREREREREREKEREAPRSCSKSYREDMLLSWVIMSCRLVMPVTSEASLFLTFIQYYDLVLSFSLLFKKKKKKKKERTLSKLLRADLDTDWGMRISFCTCRDDGTGGASNTEYA